MTAKSLPVPNVVKSTLSELVAGLDPVAEAISSEWCRAKSRKIGPTEIVMAYICVLLVANASYSRLARHVGCQVLETVSRQAVHKRTNKNLVAYFNRLVNKALLDGMAAVASGRGIDNRLFEAFSQVLIEDSSCVPLPEALAGHFPGAANGSGGRKAMLKVDTMLDVKHWVLRRLTVNPYSKNDQSQAVVAVESVERGTLLIRDLGYFTIKALAETADKGAFYLTRLKYGVGLCDLDGRAVRLEELLKEGQALDRRFLMGQAQLPVRLVAIPLPRQEADGRRRKAAKDRDRRLNHSADYIHRLGWTILITNVDEDVWATGQVAVAYGYRWFVETLFKTWKSHFNLDGQPCPRKPANPYPREPKHPYKAEALVLASLLFTVLVQMPLMAHFLVTNQPEKGQPMVSMLQVARMVADHFAYATAEQVAFLAQSMPYFCKYDTRKRHNAAERYAERVA